MTILDLVLTPTLKTFAALAVLVVGFVVGCIIWDRRGR